MDRFGSRQGLTRRSGSRKRQADFEERSIVVGHSSSSAPMRHIANLFVHFGAAVPPTGEHEDRLRERAPMRHIANLFVHFGAAVPSTGEHEKGCPEAGNAWHCGKGRRGSAEPIDQPRQEAQDRSI